ncbi:MAG TPA: exodeoxyribonuclease III [Verrucomicrobia bacterium]|nr:MAG: exodeoxyribonuclease III [Lentisphaerae bacterium GWF2_57_35]HBA86113.1 exodeoxyribonuclease III [Verrucomicrobiota bacterium]
MKIATFNANSIRSRQDAILQWMAEHRPDVLCVQETKVQDHEFPQDVFTQAGYHVIFKGQKSYNGVALISRQAPEAVSFGLDDGGPADEPRLLAAKIGPVHIVNTYVPQGREMEHELFIYKLEWFRRLRELFGRRFKPTDWVVWVGDLNVAKEPIDVHSPEQYANHVCFHESVRKAFSVCLDWGFVDVFRQFHPEADQYTFFDYRTINAVKRNIGWRLDYILATPALASKAVNCEIDMQPRLAPKASDHTFLSADFNL